MRDSGAPLIRKTRPYGKHIAHKAIQVEPRLMAEIEYRAESAAGKCGIRSSRAYRKTSDSGSGALGAGKP